MKLHNGNNGWGVKPHGLKIAGMLVAKYRVISCGGEQQSNPILNRKTAQGSQLATQWRRSKSELRPAIVPRRGGGSSDRQELEKEKRWIWASFFLGGAPPQASPYRH